MTDRMVEQDAYVVARVQCILDSTLKHCSAIFRVIDAQYSRANHLLAPFCDELLANCDESLEKLGNQQMTVASAKP